MRQWICRRIYRIVRQARRGSCWTRNEPKLLERLLGELKDVQADALRLRFFGELKFQKIADVMNCSLGTAKNHVRAGLTNLAKLLQNYPTFTTEPSGGPKETSDEL